MSDFTPTAEQQAIIATAREGDNLVITAGAGTGKTSTLKMMSELMSGTGLYVAYNKAIQMEAASKFPRHVNCRTAHSLAYAAVGKRYRNRMEAPAQPAKELARILQIKESITFDADTRLQPTQLARLARETVDRFCMSADPEITQWHVPYQRGIDHPEWKKILREAVLPYARAAWANLQADDRHGRFDTLDPSSYRGWVRYSHSHYLKMWQLMRPRLHADFILFDEAQDASPVIADIVQSQQSSQLIAVGDRSQQLYAWNGAVDSLDDWPADQELTLSESFRFGPEIAHEANKWLHVLDADLRITGRGPRGAVGEIKGWPDAVLCRTNADAMDQAMKAMADGKRTAISGGGDAIARLAEAAIDLKEGRGTGHAELCVFNTWKEVQDYVENDGAGSLRTLVNLIDDHGAEEILDAVERLVPEKPSKFQRGRFRKPDVLISTGHKSKGLEWDRVRISDDFREPADLDDGTPGSIDSADAMLAYVAVTRAKKHLDKGGLAWIDSRPELATMPADLAARRTA